MRSWRREPEVDPASVGVDAGVLDTLVARFDAALAAGELFHGAQMALYRHGRCVLEVGGGLARVRTGEPVTPDTRFVIYSATKGIAALVMLMLYERRKLHFDEPVVRYWPEFAGRVPEKAAVSIRHVLGHRGGFPVGPDWLTAEHWPDRAALRRAMEEIPLRWGPGERNGYHAMNFGHVLNELVERIDGRDLGRFAAEEIFAPLGIDDFHIGLPEDPSLEARVAWVYNKIGERPTSEATGVAGPSGSDPVRSPAATSRQLEAGEEVYEPDPSRPGATPEHRHPFNRPRVWRAVLPAAGGIATARALAGVYAPLALGGSHADARLVSQEGLRHCTTPTNRRGEVDAIIGLAIRWGTGWHMDWYGKGSSLRTFGHGGAGGQVGFADPDRGMAFAFLCNGQRSSKYLMWRFGLQSLAFEACA